MALAQNVVAKWHGLSKINENDEYVEQNNIVNIASNVCLALRSQFVILKALFVKKGRKFLRFQIGTLKRVTKMFDLRRDREDITDCDIIGENQELFTNRDRLYRLNKMFRI